MSGFLVVLAGLALLGYDAYLFISHSTVLYNSFFSVFGLEDFTWQSLSVFSVLGKVFFASHAAYYAFLVAVGCTAGLIILSFAQFLGAVAAAGVSKGEMFAKFVIRFVSLVLWGVFTIVFVNWILPFCIVLSQSGLQEVRAGHRVGIIGCAGAFVMLILTFHLHVIFIRLVALRPRLFGGEAEIIEAENGDHVSN